MNNIDTLKNTSKTTSKGLTIAETFVGCGGSHFGFKKAGFDAIFVNDIWDDALKTLKLNDNVQMALATLYVSLGFWHAYIKIQNGRLTLRALIFTVSAVILTCMWIWLMVQAFNS